MKHQATSRFAWQDALFERSTLLFALVVLATLVAILATLVMGAWPTLSGQGVGFLTNASWDPVRSVFGGLAPLWGTIITASLAMLIAVPVSFGIAMFLTEMCPAPLRRPLGIAVELLAAIPSIIYGMWGLFVFAPVFSEYVQPFLSATLGKIPFLGVLFQGAPIGIGVLSAGIILSVMVIPFTASVIRDVFETTPAILKESAYALGATTWEVVWNVVLPFTKTGAVGAVMLGLGRALGETMAVTFVIGNAYNISPKLFEPGNSIASSLANEFNEASDPQHLSALISLGLLLFLLTFVVLTCSRLLLARMKRREGKQ